MKKIFIGIAIVTALAGAFLFYWNHIAMNPGEAFLQYMSYAEEGKYEEMYQMLDEESKKGTSKNEFIQRNQNIYEGISAKNIKVEIISKNREKHVVFRVKMDSCTGRIEYQSSVQFVKEDGKYCLQWDDSVIFPQLTAEDKVRVVTIKAKRGEIKDRNGRILAGQGDIYSIGIVPGKMEKTTLKKAEKFLDITESEMKKKLEAKWVTNESFVPIQKMREYPKELLKIPGIMVSKESSRVYPLGMAAAHLVGYIQNGEGKTGLEKLYDEKLKGKDGKKIYIQNERGEVKKNLAIRDEADGEDIQTTIDSLLQRTIYEQYKTDKSCHTAMNPKTGEILALVSTPSYDSQAFVWGITDRQWKRISEDKNQPMQNRWKGTWCPGSSLKPIIGAIGLTAGRFSAEEDFGNSKTSWRKDASWGNYRVTTLHNYDNHVLQNALIYSDNIYFAKAALKIGKDTLQKQLKNIGFCESISFPFAMTKSSYANGEEIETEIQLADSGYGQGQMLVNPVHMASIYSAFSNQGDMVKPRLVVEKGQKTKIWKQNVFSKEAVKQIQSGMKQVIDHPNGTGHKAKTAGLDIWGKTGTAEIKLSKDDTKGTELGWFITITEQSGKMGPVELVSMAEDVKTRGGSGYVVERTKNILEVYMQKK